MESLTETRERRTTSREDTEDTESGKGAFAQRFCENVLNRRDRNFAWSPRRDWQNCPAATATRNTHGEAEGPRKSWSQEQSGKASLCNRLAEHEGNEKLLDIDSVGRSRIEEESANLQGFSPDRLANAQGGLQGGGGWQKYAFCGPANWGKAPLEGHSVYD
ncbi:UNVERIFIED_CONTAM: hypothetical protein HHA_453150 [Hammondia hammondi]|eukprot:XP_008886410.1 hypothetical protein HHA_453150 [Hammondia hammondi]